MPDTAQTLLTLDEFLAWEREQPQRCEFVDGVAYMMTGASLRHVTITGNFVVSLRQALRGTGCRPFASDAKVIANGSVRYPDVSVTCRPIDGETDTVPDPVLIVEVVSPSTARTDRGRKKLDYFATLSVRQYAIVEQEERLVDLYTRTEQGWVNEVIADNGVLRLSSLAIEIPLDAIYEDTGLDATRPPASEAPAPAA